VNEPLLALASGIYGGVCSIRNFLYDKGILPSYRPRLPVVCVGNLSAGGNGKTPLCGLLVHMLKRRGFRPVILSRGYGARIRQPTLVSEQSTSTEVGDEPLILAKSCPVVVDPDRVRGMKFIEDRLLGDVVVMDDGFQHRRLRRTVDIVSVNVSTPAAVRDFIEAKVIPAGRFRERRPEGLARAALIVLSGRGAEVSDEVERQVRSVLPPTLPVLRSNAVLLPPRALKGGAELEPAREVVAFCGLANPEGFFAALGAAGYRVRAEEAYPDHHRFTEREISLLKVKHSGLPLVCTEKDAVKLGWYSGGDLFVAGMECRIDRGDLLESIVLPRLVSDGR
jgi:tetraacyldisaccharide 4'-kinase